MKFKRARPGATFLTTYQLTQTQCGTPGLVVVYGPQDSVVCAQPNSNVGAGEYRLDTVTLDLMPINGPPPATTPRGAKRYFRILIVRAATIAIVMSEMAL